MAGQGWLVRHGWSGMAEIRTHGGWLSRHAGWLSRHGGALTCASCFSRSPHPNVGELMCFSVAQITSVRKEGKHTAGKHTGGNRRQAASGKPREASTGEESAGGTTRERQTAGRMSLINGSGRGPLASRLGVVAMGNNAWRRCGSGHGLGDKCLAPRVGADHAQRACSCTRRRMGSGP